MEKENGEGHHDNPDNRHEDIQETDWIEKHLTKILVLVGVLCVLGLTGRAMTG